MQLTDFRHATFCKEFNAMECPKFQFLHDLREVETITGKKRSCRAPQVSPLAHSSCALKVIDKLMYTEMGGLTKWLKIIGTDCIVSGRSQVQREV